MESRQPVETTRSRPWTVLYALAAVAILYFARPVLVPVALGVLLAFVASPLVTWIERWVKRRAISLTIATVLLLGVVGGLTVLVGKQFLDLANELPTYRDRVVGKVRELRAGPAGLMGRAADNIGDFGDQLSHVVAEKRGPAAETKEAAAETKEAAEETKEAAAATKEAAGETKEAAAELKQAAVETRDAAVKTKEALAEGTGAGVAKPVTPEPAPVAAAAVAPMALGGVILKWTVQVVASASVVILIMIMMLWSRESIRDRVIRLAGLQQIGLTTQTLEDAGDRVSKYLLAQLLVNAIFGTSVGVSLLLLGVPNAALCGLTAGVLRFIPMLGPWLGAVIPIFLAVAVFDEWNHLMVVVAVFAVLEILNNMVLEPWLYGAKTGLSSFGIVLALVFWTWIWGGVGLVLAVPLTACLVVFSKLIPQLGVLTILLGDEPVLSDPIRYYQRLLVRDEEEAAGILNAVPADKEAPEVLDEVVIPSLAAARADLQRRLITPAQASLVATAAREVALEWLADRDTESLAPIEHDGGARVACIPATDDLDEAAATILAALLQRSGVDVTVTPAGLLVSEKIRAATAEGVGLVIVSSVEPSNAMQTRRICKTMQRQRPDIPVIVVAWGAPQALEGENAPELEPGAVAKVTSNRQALAAAKAILTTQGSRDLAEAPAGDGPAPGVPPAPPLARKASYGREHDRDTAGRDPAERQSEQERGPSPAKRSERPAVPDRSADGQG